MRPDSAADAHRDDEGGNQLCGYRKRVCEQPMQDNGGAEEHRIVVHLGVVRCDKRTEDGGENEGLKVWEGGKRGEGESRHSCM